MLHKICAKTGQKFTVSDREMALRKKLGVEGEPEYSPVYRFLEVGAFWQHFNLHQRKCDRTGKDIISVFRPDCPYPVWHHDEWVKHANPPYVDFDETKDIFSQMREVFQKSPIPHNVGAGNENCEYTDDWWYSKDCYLCHSGYRCEDLRYCYRTINVKDCQFCVFSWDSELCVDLINCYTCFNTIYAYNCRSCMDSAFLYDCRHCKNCMFCWNLRNKEYCFGNEQLTKEQFEQKRKEWDFYSRKTYDKAKALFITMMKEKAWHRALYIDQCENVSGNYNVNDKNCENCFFVNDYEDAINCVRAVEAKDVLDTNGAAINGTELVYYSQNIIDRSYYVKWSFSLTQCKYMEYCAHCFQCEHCFGCCGLVGKKYCIFNKEYTPEEYKRLKEKIIHKMKQEGAYGHFFPGYFAANPYEESWSYFYWPLTKDQQKKFGFATLDHRQKRESHYLDSQGIPDRSDEVDESLSGKIFWDEEEERPFQIQRADIDFCKSRGVPLPNTFYIRRIKENFQWIPFDGTTRTVRCGKCGIESQTSWRKEYEGRILCEGCYEKMIY